MNDGWEVQWRFSKPPMMFQTMVHPKNDPDNVSIAANQMNGSPGSSYQPRGGDYFLTFNTSTASRALA